uniref:Uncharacterized protein n=1 Tax=Anopheles dirus TaxID=7168 RepID=A0A182N6L1_9DIPT
MIIYEAEEGATQGGRDDEHSLVHGVLTSDNLFDGTVVTNLEQYYIEPAARYSPELERRHGVHTVIYKLSDVKIHQNHHHGHHRPQTAADARNGSAAEQGQTETARGGDPKERPSGGERVLNLAKNHSSARTQFNPNKSDGAAGGRSGSADASGGGVADPERPRRTGTAPRKTRRKRRWLEEDEVFHKS